MDTVRHLMAAYFHQDWSAEYDGSWQAAVDDFARREPARVRGAVEEMATLLATASTDTALAGELESLGNYYWPGEHPTAHTDWLRDVIDRLETD